VAKIKLRFAGNFTEIGYDDDPNAPSIVASRGKRVAGNKQEVVAYLRSATTFIYSPGREEDHFDPRKSAGSSSIVTDGVWVWPASLAYYVETYDVALPPDFEAHMANSRFQPRPVVDKLALELPRP